MLLLDIRLPSISELSLYRTLKTELRAWPTVFISGHINSSIKEELDELKEGDYLLKPFRNEFLIEKVRNALKLVHQFI